MCVHVINYDKLYFNFTLYYYYYYFCFSYLTYIV
jgi:hypothetical protein